MSDDDEAADSGDDVAMTMVIACSVAGAVFSIIYLVFWRRSQRGSEPDNEHDSRSSATDHSLGSRNNEPAEEEDPPAPIQKFTHEWHQKERQLGDPIFDQMIIHGTAALGVLLWIGSIIVLSVTLANQSKLDGASSDDFVSLGGEACLVTSSARYAYSDVRENARLTVCVEVWEYNVLVFFVHPEKNTSFVSPPVSSRSCIGTCENCAASNRLSGPQWFVGLDPRFPGSEIVGNETFVQCFQSTIPAQDLSSYYECDGREQDGTCFLLEDTASALEKEEESARFGLIAASGGFAGGALLLLLVMFFRYRNRTVRERELQELERIKEEEKLEKVEPEEHEDSVSPSERLESESVQNEDGGAELQVNETEDD